MMRSAVLLLVLVFLVPMSVPVRAQASACVALPANVLISASYRAWIDDLVSRSATLQRQCAVIAAAPRVVVRVVVRGRVEADWRARTVFARDSTGLLHARVELPVSIDFAELLAHELEHVLEQIEGVNLRRLARVSQSGVRQVGRNLFETARASDAGLTAAAEVMTAVMMIAARD